MVSSHIQAPFLYLFLPKDNALNRPYEKWSQINLKLNAMHEWSRLKRLDEYLKWNGKFTAHAGLRTISAPIRENTERKCHQSLFA